jgi:polysaccharide biosynthesis protein PslG
VPGVLAPHHRPRFRLALLIAVVLSLAGSSQARAAEIGVVGDITWGQSHADVDREVALVKAAGAKWIRANVNWRWLEPDAKGQIDPGLLAQYDYAIDRARAAGLEVLMPIADAVPYWASGDPRKHVDAGGERHWDRYHPPASMRDFGDFTHFVVSHFRQRGVHAYEIWNEPNTSWFWSSGPNASQYVEMLRASYPAAKAADPRATVILGGLARSDFEYLEQVYRAGGGPYFDAVAVHPYTYGVDPTVSWNGANPGEDPARLSYNSFPAIKEIKATMDAFGDTAKQVWLTEFGYSTTSADGGVSEAVQAEYLTKAYEYAERFPWVHSIFWYGIRNSPFYADADTYEGRFGLTTTGWRPKPAFAALQAYAAQAQTAPAERAAPGPISAPVVKRRLRVLRKRRATAAGRPRLARPSCRAARSSCARYGRRLVVYGRIPAALAGRSQVRLQLQHRSAGSRGWAANRVKAHVHGRRYTRRFRAGSLRRGRWRVRAIVAGPDGDVRRSRYRYFRLGAHQSL